MKVNGKWKLPEPLSFSSDDIFKDRQEGLDVGNFRTLIKADENSANESTNVTSRERRDSIWRKTAGKK